MTFHDTQTIYPESMEPEVKNSPKKSGGFFLTKLQLLIAAVLFLIICIIIGVACYYGGKNKAAENKGKTSDAAGSISSSAEELETDSFGSTRGSTIVSTTEPEPSPEELRLPRSLLPIRYDLRIKSYLPSDNSQLYDESLSFTFDGQVAIEVHCKELISVISLNSVNLSISERSVKIRDITNQGSPIRFIKMEEKKKLEMVLFHLGEPLLPGRNYTISMNYRGPISEKLAGFYRSHYMENGVQRWLGVTQFQPTDARKAFPGFDEPDLKAVFGITIEHPEQFSALSNGIELEISENPSSPGWFVTKFLDSKKMSSYLVAWAVCQFNYTEAKTRDGIRFRIWARPSLVSQTEYAKTIGPIILDYYEEYYGIPFPLEKQDMIALPDFEAGAMENWGLITYREAYLLYDETIYSLANKQSVAVVIAHELAHQWFGNLVTTKWWDDLWLNEGFASLMEYFGTENATGSDFNMMTQFVRSDVQRAMAKDQMATSHPMLIYIGKAYEVYEIFDAISYQKGASIIRMVMQVMGQNDFRTGLRNYLREYQYGNADHKDLWSSLSQVASTTDWAGKKLNVTEFADAWTIQMGYPLVSVKTNNDGYVVLTQNRFKLDPDALEKEEYRNPKYGYKWHIPLWYRTQRDPDVKVDWLPMGQSKTLNIGGLSQNNWFLLNVGVNAFHRTQYDVSAWNQLSDQLVRDNEEIPAESRSQLLDDAFTLAQTGELAYETALNLTRYLGYETNYVPWSSAISHLHDIASRFMLTESYGDVKKYLLNIMTPVYNKYGYDYTLQNPNDVLEQKLQSLAISDACYYENSNCTKIAHVKFEQLKADCSGDVKLSGGCNGLQTHLRGSIYCSSVSEGDSTDWDFLWEKYLIEDISVEKDRLFYALACSKQSWILAKLLSKAIEGREIRHQDTATVFFHVSANSVGRSMMWGYLNKNWKKISQTFGDSFFTMNYIIKASTSSMNSEYDISQLQHFLMTYPSASKFSGFKEALEKTKINADWMKRNGKSLVQWFKNQNSN